MHVRLFASAREALDPWGFGMASVRFICGTQAQHRDLERAILLHDPDLDWISPPSPQVSVGPSGAITSGGGWPAALNDTSPVSRSSTR